MDIYKLNNKELKEVSKEFDKTAYGSKCKLFIFLPLVMIFFLILMLVGLLVLSDEYTNDNITLIYTGIFVSAIAIIQGLICMSQLHYGKMLKEYVDSKNDK